MNYHFTTTKAHIVLNGGSVEEIFIDEALNITSNNPFKGNMNIDKLKDLIETHGSEKIAFIRLEAGTNLIGGQPFALENMHEVREVCDQYGLLLVLDASLLADNLYFIKEREEKYKTASIREITREIADL
jgi:tyrosine phenol-lyase